MEANFWHDRWQSNQIGFHNASVHPMLERHFDAVGLNRASRVFVPLCGKTVDIPWLAAQGHRVVGAELSEVAVIQLFETMEVDAEVVPVGAMKLYKASGIEVFAGDIFELDADMLGQIDAVYDRAALVALPTDMRARYAAHLVGITRRARQLLITFDYDQDVMNGPPFSVPMAQVGSYYGDTFEIEVLERTPVEGGLKGIAPAIEEIALLR